MRFVGSSLAVAALALGLLPSPARAEGERSRTFALAGPAKGSSVLYQLELVATADSQQRDAAAQIELRLGPVGKAPSQVLKVPVAAGTSLVLGSAELVDFNFDGAPDLWFVREMGAKWGRYEALSFDSKSGRFVKDAVSREISKLDNPAIDAARHEIVSGTVGPVEPSRFVRKVEKGKLVVVEECHFDNSADKDGDDKNEGTLVLKQLEKGALKTVLKKTIAVRWGDNPCATELD